MDPPQLLHVIHHNWNFTEDLPLTDELIQGGFSRDGWRNSQLNLVPDGQKELIRGRCGGKKKRQTWNAKGSGLTRTQSRSASLNFDDVYVDSEKNFPAHSRRQLSLLRLRYFMKFAKRKRGWKMPLLRKSSYKVRMKRRFLYSANKEVA